MFITLEGVEGSGKSTVLQKLATHFRSLGHEVLCTREPGGCALGQNLRKILLHADSRICSEAELFLFLADRAQHVNEVIRPALAKGCIVLCDRYVDSTIAYQGAGRGLNQEGTLALQALNSQATSGLMPHLTLLLDLPIEQGLARAYARNAAQENNHSEGRFDSESLAFHAKVQAQFKQCAQAEPERFFTIDASLDAEAVFTACLQVCMKKINFKQGVQKVI